MSEAKIGEKNHFYGKSHSKEMKNKISETRKGGNNPKAKKVVCGNKIFSCLKDCAKYYDIKYETMKSWIKGYCNMPEKFIKLGLRWATNEDLSMFKNVEG